MYSPTWLSQVLVDPTGQWQAVAVENQLADTLASKAWGITPENVDAAIKARSQLLRSVYPAFSQLSHKLHLQPTQLLETLWNLWLPLAIQIAAYRRHQQAPFVQGILGGQGTGKTTLTAILTLILSQLGYRTLSLSLDDLYKTYRDRLALKKQDPRLVWRGPPGTHDLDLGLSVLDQLRQANLNTSIAVPRFDKSACCGAGDRTKPEIVTGVDIVLFEGWFVGVRPIAPAAFDTAPPPIDTAADRQFARDMNVQLQNYLPLWQRLDKLILLYPRNYQHSLEWRRQAEHQMIASDKSGMTDAEIEEFVKYFWRSLHPDLFIKPLTNYPSYVDLVIEINPDHAAGAVYRPTDATS